MNLKKIATILLSAMLSIGVLTGCSKFMQQQAH